MFKLGTKTIERCSNTLCRYLTKNLFFLFLIVFFLFIQATDAFCLLDIYNFLRDRLQSSDYLQSFRGKITIPSQTSNDISTIS